MWPSHSESYFRKRPARMRSTGYRPVRSRKIPMSHPHRPAAALVALALAAPASALAEPGAIKGQDVMGDRSRCANDAPDPGGNSTAMNRDRPVPNAGSSDDSGSDPHQVPDVPRGRRTAAPQRA